MSSSVKSGLNPAPTGPESRVIRVFLSSTFRDFMEERDLLVKEVFPELRRKARERGVDVVDVDLRWGITEEESHQGKVIGICLAEIERCRPYFIGMLGDRYGWTPAINDYPDELFEREQLGWIRDHQGGASVTELEILHGVLNDKEMAGRAFFYFRDQAWSLAQSGPGFVCVTQEEESKLVALKDRICSSGFPVVKDLPDPKAIAKQIEADLWSLIEEQYPDLDQADSLEREARKHASYRQSRLSVYLGQQYVEQLEELICANEQKILITGDSGSGKSALIANWMEQHSKSNPTDVVYAHHLGCSNDANDIRLLLGRMLDTASKLLKDAELITEPIKVPQDWWELTAKVAETLQDLGRWCLKTSHRLIWVLDGLDRLAEEDQQALPWLPLLIPEGVSVVISALNCQARAIVQERQFQLLEIGPLLRNEQEQLIETYLERYTKKLDADRLQQIMACDLASSPLFLRVLLEELRQCGRFETLEAQIGDYIKINANGTLAVNDLYGRVLKRLENDCGVEPVQRALTALWASRAGLSEPELQAITELAPLQWAPIDLALEKAFGRNGNRLVFDHDYLRIAVEDRYLPTEEQKLNTHSELADWYQDRDGWHDSEELPWQLQEAGRLLDLREWLLDPIHLAYLSWHRSSRETINYWLVAKEVGGGELDELIADAVEKEIEERKDDTEDLIWFVNHISGLLDEAGLYRELLVRLRTTSLELEEATEGQDEESILSSLDWLARAHSDMGNYNEAEALFLRCLEARERLLGPEHPDTLTSIGSLGLLYKAKGDFDQSETFYKRCLEACERLLGPEHPSTLSSINNLANLYSDKGEYQKAEVFYKRCLEAQERLLGPEHQDTLSSINNLANLYSYKGEYEKAETFYNRCLEAQERLLGPEHPKTLISINNLALLYSNKGEYEKAETLYKRCLEAQERLLGPEHPNTLTSINNLALLYSNKGEHEKAETFCNRCLEASERLLGPEHPSTLRCINNLAVLYSNKGECEKSEVFFNRCLEARERLLGPEHPSTLISINNLALLYRDKGEYEKAEALHKRCLEASERLLGPEHPNTLTSINNLANLYSDKGDYEKSETFHKRCLEARERLLGAEHPDTNSTRFYFASLLSNQERYNESIPLRRQELDLAVSRDGRISPSTLISIHRLAQDLYWSNELEEAEQLFREALAGRISELGDNDADTMASRYQLARCLSAQEQFKEAIELRRQEFYWCQTNEQVEIPDMLISMEGLGCDLLAAGETEEALELLQNCLAQRQTVLGISNNDTLSTLIPIFKALAALNRQQEAISLSQITQEALAAELGENAPEVLTQLFNQASLQEELGELEAAEALFKQCLSRRIESQGQEHPDTNYTIYCLAELLSNQNRQAEAIPLRQQELAWCRTQKGYTDPSTLSSINQLAIDLRETNQLEEAEMLFRELVESNKQVLEEDDFEIGRALGGLARTLEEAGKLEDAVAFAHQALDHRHAHEGPDAWVTNRNRLDLAQVLHKLGRSAEALSLLDQLQHSMGGIAEPEQEDLDLIEAAVELRGDICSGELL